MLALVPAALPDFADAAEFYAQAVYADLAGQLAAVGVTAPAEPADDAAAGPWRAALAPLAVPDTIAPAFSRAEDRARWQAFFGFSPLDIDEALGVGGAPAELLLLRGRFDHAAVQAAWAASGYRPLDLGGDPVSWLEHVDIGSPGGLGMKYAAVLPGGMLLFARQPEIARGVLDVLAGRAAPAGASTAAALLLVAPGDLASAVLVPGTRFAGGLPSGSSVDPRIDATVIATRAADAAAAAAEAAALPWVQTALLGLTAGGPVWPGGRNATPRPVPAGRPVARFVVALVFADDADARAAVAVLEERLATGRAPGVAGQEGRPYTELFPKRRVRVAEGGERVVLVELGFGPDVRPAIWWSLARDPAGPDFLARGH